MWRRLELTIRLAAYTKGSLRLPVGPPRGSLGPSTMAAFSDAVALENKVRAAALPFLVYHGVATTTVSQLTSRRSVAGCNARTETRALGQTNNLASDWKDYQEETAEFFRGLGLDATTDVRIDGVRTRHDVDVLVRSRHVGFEIVWLVECKHWQTPVSKLHVLGLRAIVSDVGADRGVLLCEVGFQSGAVEAATLTNVHVTSLGSLRQSASVDIFAMRLRELNDRTLTCKQRYWDIPKEERIKRGLRQEFAGYSGAGAVGFAEELVAKALRGVYPFECDGIGALMMTGGVQVLASPTEVLAILEPLIAELERLLDGPSTPAL
jgi:restriction system protein